MTPEGSQWRRSDDLLLNSEQILHIILVFQLLNLNK